MFEYSNWLNTKWPGTERSASEWMNIGLSSVSREKFLQDAINNLSSNWKQDTWGKDKLWQTLDSTLNESTEAQQNLNISYGEKPWQKLDVITSRKNTTARSVLVFFYGGGWHDGSKERYRYVGSAFAQLGYTVVIPDYVKYPDGRFPDFVEDGALAMSWVKNNIAHFGGNFEHLFVAGHSAGAHLGALLCTDQRYLTEVNINKSEIRAFCGLAGPYDFTPLIRRYQKVFDNPDLHPDINVSKFIDGTEPPMMLAKAGADMIVGGYTQTPLERALSAANVEFDNPTYKGMGHMGIVLALSNQGGTVLDDMHQFFNKEIEAVTI